MNYSTLTDQAEREEDSIGLRVLNVQVGDAVFLDPPRQRTRTVPAQIRDPSTPHFEDGRNHSIQRYPPC